MSRKRKWALGLILLLAGAAGVLWLMAGKSSDEANGRPSATERKLADVLDRIGLRTEFARHVRIRERQWRYREVLLEIQDRWLIEEQVSQQFKKQDAQSQGQ